jgi:diaminopimelate epimerase
MGHVLKDVECTVTLPGGDLLIRWREDSTIQLSGPARYVFEGTTHLSLFQE